MSYLEKIKTLPDLEDTISQHKKNGRTIVHCHGVFDLLHLGHIRHLNSAKAHGDTLVVTITSDTFVKRGPGRPVFTGSLRAEALAHLSVTDLVCIIEEPTALSAIAAIKPHFYVKGPDYKEKSDDITGKIHEELRAVEMYGGTLVCTDDLTFSSSKLLNLHFNTYPQDVRAHLDSLCKEFTFEDLHCFLERTKKLRIMVVGDTIIDQYHYCSSLGKASKANIIAHKYLSDDNFAGGSAATANHAAELGAAIEFVSVLGRTHSFEDFLHSRLHAQITAHFTPRAHKVTTTKRRYVSSEDNTKLFEVCFIDDEPLSPEETRSCHDTITALLPTCDLVIVSDFGHGMLTESLINLLCEHAPRLALNVQTNSANFGFNLVTKYPRADFVCIDERELRHATHSRFSKIESLAESIYTQLGCEQIIVTRGPDGSTAFNAQEGFHHTPALAHKKIDAVGAGDAFFAYTAPAYAVGMPQKLLGLLGNIVASLKLQIPGNKEPVKCVDVAKFAKRVMNL